MNCQDSFGDGEVVGGGQCFFGLSSTWGCVSCIPYSEKLIIYLVTLKKCRSVSAFKLLDCHQFPGYPRVDDNY